jgi:hypothetical protein
MEFGRQFIAGIKSAQTIAELDEWSVLNHDRLTEMAGAAPRPHGSVVKALAVMAEKLEPPATDPVETPRLPAKESQQLRRALVKKLAECRTLADVDAWRTTSEEGFTSLQDEDRIGVTEFEAQRRDQLNEVMEVVGR